MIKTQYTIQKSNGPEEIWSPEGKEILFAGKVPSGKEVEGVLADLKKYESVDLVWLFYNGMLSVYKKY